MSITLQKRLILCCDGTGKSSMRGPAAIPTNVTRLCSALQDTSTQIIFYQSGVGTAIIGEMYTTVASGTDLGINDNILDAYQLLSNNYEVGDEKAWARYVRPDKGAAFNDFVKNCGELIDVNLKQCWFPCVHTNVGGGYPDSHMADLTLFWMLEQCRAQLWKTEKRHLTNLSRVGQRKNRRLLLDESHAVAWNVLSSKGITNEVMHRSVRSRWQCNKLKWKPRALSGFSPVQSDDSCEWRWVKPPSGGQSVAVELPEEIFQRSPTSWQRRLRDVSAKRMNFSRKLDFLPRNSHAYLRDDYEPPIERTGQEANSASKVAQD
ncbi:hypothetical protein EV426DRAFT_570971 [Tirmania nivea]|nr:hypothetical protein EV426DRAFT_570971 [Tirmania nivea]